MDRLAETIAVYDANAEAMAEYFGSLGARVEDIAVVLKAVNKQNPHIIEIGCGDGRDAIEIVKHTNNYMGFDASKGLIKIAQQKVPDGTFTIDDVRTFSFPDNTDVIFAFASLLHLNKTELADVVSRAHAALSPGGVLFISMKHADEYTEFIKNDAYGSRLFYLYDHQTVINITKDRFDSTILNNDFITGTDTRWFEMLLVKK